MFQNFSHLLSKCTKFEFSHGNKSGAIYGNKTYPLVGVGSFVDDMDMPFLNYKSKEQTIPIRRSGRFSADVCSDEIPIPYPKLYNIAHLFTFNVFTDSKGSNNYILFIAYRIKPLQAFSHDLLLS